MIDVVERVDVAAPVEVTWAAITDWPGQGEWMLGTTVKVVGGDGRGIGSALSAFTGVGPLGFTDTMEITAWDPPTRCEVRHTGRIVRGTGVFEVRPRGAGSTLVWEEHLEGGPLIGLGWRLGGVAFRVGVRHSLRRFARLAEARA
ncbi:SRPBCC family protein [Actinokineospora sp. HUAS TT18]|uniref:SRPBCC family protein n=1 Tax=Actinokineospora sp. HUAS TT18 TaxID=3447451 RepID=UPI003F527EAE